MLGSISDLLQALEQNSAPDKPGVPGTYQLSDDIKEMFYAHEDDKFISNDTKQTMKIDRFEDGRRLYQTVRDNVQIDDGTGKKYAIFYRLDDKFDTIDVYEDHLKDIRTDFKDYVENQLQRAPTTEVNDFFSDQKNSFILAPNVDKERVIDYLISVDKSLLETDDLTDITDWFKNKKDNIEEIAEGKFYQTPSTVPVVMFQKWALI